MKKQYWLYNCGLALLFFQLNWGCIAKTEKSPVNPQEKLVSIEDIVLGNERFSEYLPLLEGKKVAFVGNHTSFIGETHLLDSLLSLHVEIVKVFSPEHGFRGEADAGEKVNNETDRKTGLPIISLYGKNKKPTVEQLKGVDVLIFDIQDVGVRFYTYISTLHYVMEAVAENDKKLIVLDRPNPNGHYIDGPILESSQKSFVGLHPVPIVHGMTIGEYAKMINGEGWLKNKVTCDLNIIPCLNYDHSKEYRLQKAPSPNLPNMKAVYLYPYLCLFEGTVISVGRGTDEPFQQIGHPELNAFKHSFTPKPNFGAKNPKLNGEKCFGIDFSNIELTELRTKKRLEISYLLDFYEKYPGKDFFLANKFFDLLAGNSSLRLSIIAGKSTEAIREEWNKSLESYSVTREKYLLYED